MASDILVSSLTTASGVGQIGVVAIAAPPSGFEDLSYMQPVKVEIWAASSNNRGSATKIGETTSGIYLHGGLSASTTRYYWARAVDAAGNVGAYYPVSSTGGISGTTLTTLPPANSVGTAELKNDAVTNAKIANLAVDTANIANAAITNAKIGDAEIQSAKIANLAVNKLLSGTITAAISMTSPTINGGTITGAVLRTSASGKRVVIDGSGNDLTVYNSGGSVICSIGDLNGPVGAFDGKSAIYPAMAVSNTGGGTYAIYVNVGKIYSGDGYAPFTGMHEMLVRKANELVEGDLASCIRTISRDKWNNVVADVERSSTIGDRRIIGMVSNRRALIPYDWLPGMGTRPSGRENAELMTPVRRFVMENYDLVTLNALGEGQMLVCGRGGDIEAGDYVCSSDLAGKGQRQNDADGQPDDLLRRCTVAQAMIGVTFDDADQVKTLPVFYRCG